MYVCYDYQNCLINEIEYSVVACGGCSINMNL